MLENISLKNILFLDIETVPQFSKYENMPETTAELWGRKFSTFRNGAIDETPASVYRRAGIYAEFGKIICISVGAFADVNEFRIKSFFGHDEKQILNDFSDLLKKSYFSSEKLLCAHNGKEFDFPYLCRRFLINQLPLPTILNIAGKKPWEVAHLDTMELWKFGDYKSYTTLVLLASVFGIQTPKDDIDGSNVWQVYWEENNIERIVKYCQKDVLTVAQIFKKFRGEDLIKSEDVIFPD